MQKRTIALIVFGIALCVFGAYRFLSVRATNSSLVLPVQPTLTSTPTLPVFVTPSSGGCMQGGCSSELCIEEGEDVASPCIWREEYRCYQQAECTRQDNGECGFSKTPELAMCLENVR